jgi:(1->4)-alpha-D-glucan 1-alpha-D-glucosylmutase
MTQRPSLRVPLTTYRIQFHRGFRFADATSRVPYLHALGITDLYASPLLAARAGSMHGYDVTDPTRLNPELGSDAEFEALTDALRAHGMGLLMDIVPNHMAASAENPWWNDVLTYGPRSPHADIFAIDWGESGQVHAKGGAEDRRLLLPVLGKPYGEVLEADEFRLVYADGHFSIRYFEHVFPLGPHSWAGILLHGEAALHARLGEAESFATYRRLAAVFQKIPQPLGDAGILHPPERQTIEAAVHELARLSATDGRFAEHIDGIVRFFNDAADPSWLHGLLEAQAYRLAHWHMANEAINYRRFFDINELVGVRVESPPVTDRTHAKIFSMVHAGTVTGLRIDHIDGLRDPKGYLSFLQRRLGAASSDAKDGEPQRVYVLVEKILGENERLAPDWPVAGTTGYDFIAYVNGIFVDQHGLRFLNESYGRFTNADETFGSVVQASKRQVMHQLFPGEVNRLSLHLGRIAKHDRAARDIPLAELREALIGFTAAFPVYRTYIRSDSTELSESDQHTLEEAFASAAKHLEDGARHAGLRFLFRVLRLVDLPASPEERHDWFDFVAAWQQFSGPATAKGLEDTAFYRHTRLMSLNTVGSDVHEVEHPADVAAFHRHNCERIEHWPGSMTTTSTHDTKRSGDVNVRINVVSELPVTWARAFRRWHGWNTAARPLVDGARVPGPNEEILFYQTLLGAWPLDEGELPAFRVRIRDYMRKALKEAKNETSWIRPNAAYEAGVLEFVDAVLDPVGAQRFLRDFMRLQRRVAFAGALNGLAQVLLKQMSPGVPDTYQGDELWDFSLVDPDNRRPVDHVLRERLLGELQQAAQGDLGALLGDMQRNWSDGRIKLYVTWRSACFRRDNPALLQKGAYKAVWAEGERRENVCAFLRHDANQYALTAVPRLTTRLTTRGRFPLGERAWKQTMLTLPDDAPDEWVDVFSGVRLRTEVSDAGKKQLLAGKAFEMFPVALLQGVG